VNGCMYVCKYCMCLYVCFMYIGPSISKSKYVVTRIVFVGECVFVSM